MLREERGRGQGWPLQFRFSLVVSAPIVVVAAAIILCDAFENLSKTKSINLLCACVFASPSLRPCQRTNGKAKQKRPIKIVANTMEKFLQIDLLQMVCCRLLPTTIVRRCQTCGRFTAAYLVFYFNYLD